MHAVCMMDVQDIVERLHKGSTEWLVQKRDPGLRSYVPCTRGCGELNGQKQLESIKWQRPNAGSAVGASRVGQLSLELGRFWLSAF